MNFEEEGEYHDGDVAKWTKSLRRGVENADQYLTKVLQADGYERYEAAKHLLSCYDRNSSNALYQNLKRGDKIYEHYLNSKNTKVENMRKEKQVEIDEFHVEDLPTKSEMLAEIGLSNTAKSSSDGMNKSVTLYGPLRSKSLWSKKSQNIYSLLSRYRGEDAQEFSFATKINQFSQLAIITTFYVNLDGVISKIYSNWSFHAEDFVIFKETYISNEIETCIIDPMIKSAAKHGGDNEKNSKKLTPKAQMAICGTLTAITTQDELHLRPLCTVGDLVLALNELLDKSLFKEGMIQLSDSMRRVSNSIDPSIVFNAPFGRTFEIRRQFLKLVVKLNEPDKWFISESSLSGNLIEYTCPIFFDKALVYKALESKNVSKVLLKAAESLVSSISPDLSQFNEKDANNIRLFDLVADFEIIYPSKYFDDNTKEVDGVDSMNQCRIDNFRLRLVFISQLQFGIVKRKGPSVLKNVAIKHMVKSRLGLKSLDEIDANIELFKETEKKVVEMLDIRASSSFQKSEGGSDIGIDEDPNSIKNIVGASKMFLGLEELQMAARQAVAISCHQLMNWANFAGVDRSELQQLENSLKAVEEKKKKEIQSAQVNSQRSVSPNRLQKERFQSPPKIFGLIEQILANKKSQQLQKNTRDAQSISKSFQSKPTSEQQLIQQQPQENQQRPNSSMQQRLYNLVHQQSKTIHQSTIRSEIPATTSVKEKTKMIIETEKLSKKRLKKEQFKKIQEEFSILSVNSHISNNQWRHRKHIKVQKTAKASSPIITSLPSPSKPHEEEQEQIDGKGEDLAGDESHTSSRTNASIEFKEQLRQGELADNDGVATFYPVILSEDNDDEQSYTPTREASYDEASNIDREDSAAIESYDDDENVDDLTSSVVIVDHSSHGDINPFHRKMAIAMSVEELEEMKAMQEVWQRESEKLVYDLYSVLNAEDEAFSSSSHEESEELSSSQSESVQSVEHTTVKNAKGRNTLLSYLNNVDKGKQGSTNKGKSRGAIIAVKQKNKSKIVVPQRFATIEDKEFEEQNDNDDVDSIVDSLDLSSTHSNKDVFNKEPNYSNIESNYDLQDMYNIESNNNEITNLQTSSITESDVNDEGVGEDDDDDELQLLQYQLMSSSLIAGHLTELSELTSEIVSSSHKTMTLVERNEMIARFLHKVHVLKTHIIDLRNFTKFPVLNQPMRKKFIKRLEKQFNDLSNKSTHLKNRYYHVKSKVYSTGIFKRDKPTAAVQEQSEEVGGKLWGKMICDDPFSPEATVTRNIIRRYASHVVNNILETALDSAVNDYFDQQSFYEAQLEADNVLEYLSLPLDLSGSVPDITKKNKFEKKGRYVRANSNILSLDSVSIVSEDSNRTRLSPHYSHLFVEASESEVKPEKTVSYQVFQIPDGGFSPKPPSSHSTPPSPLRQAPKSARKFKIVENRDSPQLITSKQNGVAIAKLGDYLPPTPAPKPVMTAYPQPRYKSIQLPNAGNRKSQSAEKPMTAKTNYSTTTNNTDIELLRHRIPLSDGGREYATPEYNSRVKEKQRSSVRFSNEFVANLIDFYSESQHDEHGPEVKVQMEPEDKVSPGLMNRDGTLFISGKNTLKKDLSPSRKRHFSINIPSTR